MSMKPELASELGFLEIRQLSYEVKRISKIDRPSNEEIEKIYNQEYLSKINMWLNVVSTQIGSTPLKTALINLLVNTVKVSNNLRFHPFHIRVFKLLNDLAKSSSVFIPIS